MVRYCSISGCVSGLSKDRKIRKSLNIKQASLFSVPAKNATLLLQWSTILKMNLSDKNYICDYHFKEEDIIKEVKHDFPDGNYQIIPRERWKLLPNAIPINPEPRGYDEITQDSTDRVYQPLQQLDNQLRVNERLLQTSSEENLTQSENNMQHHSQSVESITNISTPQSVHFYTDLRNGHNGETTVDTEQLSGNLMDSAENWNSFEDIERFINIPPAWYYIQNSREIIFVHVDSLRWIEKLRLFINADLSAMVSFNQRKKIDLDLKITSKVNLLKIFKKLSQAPICKGTGMNDMSASASCCGVIFSQEKYKRRPKNPRCPACRTLRHRLLIKASMQCRTGIKKYCPRKQLKTYKKKWEKKVIG